ncbi:MAG: 50S ribosomal protein L6 [Candidatus Hydrothermarchaeales archaeon]
MPKLTKIEERIMIPENIEASLEDGFIKVNGKNGNATRKLFYPGVEIRIEGREIVIKANYPRKRQVVMIGTFASHIRNMITGVTEDFMYKMKVVYSHFPMTVKVDGKELSVANYLGEKIPRKTRIVGNCSVAVKGNEIEVYGNDIEDVGQTAANIEQLTRVKKKDSRVFQDGIYLVERNGAKV